MAALKIFNPRLALNHHRHRKRIWIKVEFIWRRRAQPAPERPAGSAIDG
jgi:hypothetical protein